MSVTYERLRTSAKGEWSFCRQLTYSLLESLSESDLQFSPGNRLGMFWMQFRHVGRIQENFLAGLRTLEMHFDSPGGLLVGQPTKAELASYLHSLDTQMETLLADTDMTTVIQWEAPGDTPQVWEHLSRMVSHEFMHQGTWVAYIRLMDKPFPTPWTWAWGLE